jgi:predicted metal-dependent HD superfamily phosphohydrolase
LSGKIHCDANRRHDRFLTSSVKMCMQMSLKENWFDLASVYSNDVSLIEKLWQEINKQYSSEERYYHNLNHIESLLRQVEDVRKELFDIDTLKFSIWYHDIVYEAGKEGNEERSARLASKRMKELNVKYDMMRKCNRQILATKSHSVEVMSGDIDVRFLLDLDLAILGTTPEEYNDYARKIRREYDVFSDSVYSKGRIEVLRHFLEKDRIFLTEKYYKRFEKSARYNLASELDELRHNFGREK